MDSSPSSPDIYIPEQWSKAANFIISSSTPPIILICGPANSGKATFSRYLLNLLFTKCDRVSYLDTNVGQPEFTPPAFLSLTILHDISPGRVGNQYLSHFLHVMM
jgi:polynucleotide 5'-hydroxyl-kinase GRC3/NOL9